MLIFMNFICWVLIVFFGIIVVVGWFLIDVFNFKIFFVFFYLLNLCVNFYLYVIIMK